MAVEVGGAEFVEVHEDKAADGGAGEGFGGGGADGAEARDDDAGAGEAGQGGRAEEQLEAFERRGHGVERYRIGGEEPIRKPRRTDGQVKSRLAAEGAGA